MIRPVLVAIALLLAIPAHADDDPSVAAFSALKKDVEQLRADKEKKQFRHNYEKLIVRLQAMANTYKVGSKADDAAFVAAQLLEELYDVSRVDADKQAAIDAFVACADRFPKSNLADDSLLEAAKLTDDTEKKRALLERSIAVPGADLVSEAKKELAALPAKPAPKPEPVAAASLMKPVDVLPEAPPAGTPSRKVIVIKHEKTAAESIVTMRVSGDVGVVKGEVPVAEGGPRRIFYDLAPAKLGQRNIQPIEVHDGVVARVRAGQYDTEVVRLVIELEGAVEPALHIQKKPTFELQLTVPLAKPADTVAATAPDKAAPTASMTTMATTSDAKIASATDAKAASTNASTKAASTNAASTNAASTNAVSTNAVPKLGEQANDLKKKLGDGTPGGVSISQQMGLAVHRVVIDAGHGGNDTGAIGPDGVKEKDITLQIAKRVRDKLLAEMPDLEVVMTRDDDRTLALQDRTNTANSAAADLFISIHCNASPLRRVRGVETYTLNITNDKYAMKLAARENAEMNEGSISDLQFILADLAMKSNVDDSVRLGRAVQKDVMNNLHKRWNDVPDLGLKHALFYVLMGNRMPSILVETSFVSNKQEEQRLASATYQDSIADGIVSGVREFVDERQAFIYQP